MKMVEKACAIFNKQPLLKGKFYKLTELNALEEKEKKDKKIKEIFTYFAEGPKAILNVAQSLYKHWPEGVAVYVNEAKTFVIKVNQPDHI